MAEEEQEKKEEETTEEEKKEAPIEEEKKGEVEVKPTDSASQEPEGKVTTSDNECLPHRVDLGSSGRVNNDCHPSCYYVEPKGFAC